MAWTRPKLREICIGMEINGYLRRQDSNRVTTLLFTND